MNKVDNRQLKHTGLTDPISVSTKSSYLVCFSLWIYVSFMKNIHYYIFNFASQGRYPEINQVSCLSKQHFDCFWFSVSISEKGKMWKYVLIYLLAIVKGKKSIYANCSLHKKNKTVFPPVTLIWRKHFWGIKVFRQLMDSIKQRCFSNEVCRAINVKL